MEALPFRGFRGLDVEMGACLSTREMPLSQFVRVLTRSMVAAAAYDQAMVQYCRDYFEAANIEDIHFRHEICLKLRGPTACSLLWGVFLDSEPFRVAYTKETGRAPPVMRDRNTEPSPAVYSDFIKETKSPTLRELKYKNTENALQQQTRQVFIKAKEVDLVEYIYINKVKTLVKGTDKLFQFFTENVSNKMDQQ